MDLTLIWHKVSDQCLIHVDPKFSIVWDVVLMLLDKAVQFLKNDLEYQSHHSVKKIDAEDLGVISI